jgi:hypothetical protein
VHLYSVSNLAKLHDADRKQIKNWAYYFSDYLNSKAISPKGIDNYNIEFVNPAIYNYRHALELYLKHILIRKINSLPNEGKIHNLTVLYSEFKELLSESFKVTLPRWFENIILAFVDFDPTGTTFRYGTSIKSDEMFIDLYHIKKMMTWFAESIHNVDAEINNNHR